VAEIAASVSVVSNPTPNFSNAARSFIDGGYIDFRASTAALPAEISDAAR
jgi:hypothetical protein